MSTSAPAPSGAADVHLSAAPPATAATPPPPSPPILLTVRPWPDPVIDTVGHDPRSVYVEQFWLSVLGPSTVLLFRRLALLFDLAPDGFSLDLGQTAAALGLSSRVPRDG